MVAATWLAGAFVRADTVTVDLEYRTDTLTWELYALVVDTGSGNTGDHGLAALRALVDNVELGTVNLAAGIGAIDPLAEGTPDERSAVLQTAGGTLDIIYGQDLSDESSVVGGVGFGGRTMLIDGTFSNSLLPPTFGDDDHSLTTDGNFLNVAAPGPFGDALPWNGVTLNVLDVTPTALLGDYNGDGTVNAADYTVWRDNLGTGDESALMGNGDGMNGVDAGDYTLWKEHFGNVVASSVSSATTAPEPSTLMLAFFAGCALLPRWRRR